jgi:hypothetical protein
MACIVCDKALKIANARGYLVEEQELPRTFATEEGVKHRVTLRFTNVFLYHVQRRFGIGGVV